MCFADGYGIIKVPHKLNMTDGFRGCVFTLVKTHPPFQHPLELSESLCGNKRSSAFFVRGFVWGCALFYEGGMRMEEKVITN